MFKPTVKRSLSRKINEANYTLVIIGQYANTRHKDYQEIGYRNWINFEVATSKNHGNKIVGIKLDGSYESPEEIYGSGASWAYRLTENTIINALNNA